MSDTKQQNTLVVGPAEAGQKLLQFLVRRLNLSQSLLHRWIRTGQIRINAGRGKPFLRIAEGDIIRIPPFAPAMAASAQADSPAKSRLPLPHLVYENEHLYAFNKPFGLPVHTGTGHTDSLATRLAEHFENASFKPTPAHRLDKDTSGIILVARSYASLRLLQDAFEQRNIIKEYLAWVHGTWPHEGAKMLNHNLIKSYEGYDEKVRVLPEDEEQASREGRESESIVTCLRCEHDCSLMHVRLITGRTHQIRVQMAAEGFAVLGDGKYGDTNELNYKLHLHALRITLPNNEDFANLGLQNANFMVLPQWQDWRNVKDIPLTAGDVGV